MLHTTWQFWPMHKCVCIHSIASFHRFLCSAGQSHLFIHIKETVGNLWLWFYTILSLFQEWAKHFDYKLWLVNSILASCILTFHLRSWRWWSSTHIWLCWHFRLWFLYTIHAQSQELFESSEQHCTTYALRPTRIIVTTMTVDGIPVLVSVW